MMSNSSYEMESPSAFLRSAFRAKATTGNPLPPPISVKCPAGQISGLNCVQYDMHARTDKQTNVQRHRMLTTFYNRLKLKAEAKGRQTQTASQTDTSAGQQCHDRQNLLEQFKTCQLHNCTCIQDTLGQVSSHLHQISHDLLVALEP